MSAMDCVRYNVRRLAKERQLTLMKLAERMGCSRPTLNAMLLGSHNCTVVYLERMAHALGVDPSDLLRN